MTETIKIRQMTGADALAYRDLRLSALQNNPESYLATFASESSRSLDSFATELRYAMSSPIFGYYGIFTETTQLVGYAQLEKSYMEKQRHIAFMYNLYISPNFRGRGLASQLFLFLLDLVKKETSVERIFISCNKKNSAAQQLYKKLGFIECGLKKNSVKWQDEYDDEIELVKEL